MAKCNFQLYLINNNRKVEFIKCFPTEKQANKCFNKMLEENKNVSFPKEYVNIDVIETCKYELLLIRRRGKNEEKTTKLRDSYGDLIEHETDSENWVVYNKAPYKIEETFWVYGYSPLHQRKTFSFIYEEIVKPKTNIKGNFLNFILFKNKLLLETLSTKDLIICKNKSDCIRLYNELQRYCFNDKKCKYYMFCGDWGNGKKNKYYYEKAIEKIHELTSWDKLKITRYNTRPIKRNKKE